MASLQDIFTTLQNGVTAINNLATQIAATFPQASALSSTATAGALSFSSSQPTAFLTVTTSSGATVKVAVYDP